VLTSNLPDKSGWPRLPNLLADYWVILLLLVSAAPWVALAVTALA
jgi:hypothetical protein